MSNSSPQLLTQQLEYLIAAPQQYTSDDAQRQKLLQTLRAAAIALETPFESVQRLAYCAFPLVAARIGQDNAIFSALAGNSNGHVVDIDSLTKSTKLDSLFLEAMMDYLCTQHMAEQRGHRQYKSTALGNTLLAPLFVDAVTHFHDNCLPAFGHLNAFLHQPNQRVATGSSSTPQTAFQLGLHTQEDFYTHLTHNPVQSDAFHNFMTAQFADLPTWLSVVHPITELKIEHSDTENAVFVDVGGGTGIQCTSFRTQHPNTKGRIILQDKPEIIARANTDPSIEKMAYDYFTPQPVKDAKIYYLRQVLHNNDDETTITILRNQATAMSTSSILIIDEKVIPDPTIDNTRATASIQDEYTAALSLAMKSMFNAQERREGHWRSLVEGTGLRVRDVRTFTRFGDSVILCERV